MFSYAVANGAKVSNNSWGGGGFSQSMKSAIRKMGDAGHIFVAAAGNNNNNNDVQKFYPASYGLPNIIAVAATNETDNKAGFSNYGATTVHLGAPGVKILSTLPTGAARLATRYGASRGTSMATPHVAGTATLLRGIHPGWSYEQIIDQILGTVDPVQAMQGKTITGGRLNIGKAITESLPAPNTGLRHASLVAASNLESVQQKTPVTKTPHKSAPVGLTNADVAISIPASQTTLSPTVVRRFNAVPENSLAIDTAVQDVTLDSLFSGLQ
jgi:subtilisin family serine protease